MVAVADALGEGDGEGRWGGGENKYWVYYSVSSLVGVYIHQVILTINLSSA